MNNEPMKKKALTIFNSWRLLLSIFVFAMLVGVPVVQATPGNFWDLVAEKVSTKLMSSIGNETIFGSAESPDCANAGHIAGCPNATGDQLFEGNVEFDALAHFDGGADVAGDFSVTGTTKLNRTITGGATTTISTGASTYAITAAQVCDNSFITLALTSSTVTYTFPATGTLFADCLSNNGGVVEVMIYNSTTTGGTGSAVFASGSGGGTIQTSSSTSVDGETYAQIEIIRIHDNLYQTFLTNRE